MSVNELLDLRMQVQQHDEQLLKLIEVIRFYADPESYFAIGFLFDEPSGAFSRDFDVPEGDWDTLDDGLTSTQRPGKLARETLTKLVEEGKL